MIPLSALSLACNVTQLLEQAVHIAKNCKEIYDRGSLGENDEIEQFAKEVAEANKELQDELATASLSRRDERIRTVAQKSLFLSNELRKILNRIKFGKAKTSGTSNAFKAWIRTTIKKGQIEKLQKQLQEQERQLGSGMLKDV